MGASREAATERLATILRVYFATLVDIAVEEAAASRLDSGELIADYLVLVPNVVDLGSAVIDASHRFDDYSVRLGPLALEISRASVAALRAQAVDGDSRLSDLAQMLNKLAIWQSAMGNRLAAVASLEEAVEYHRLLAERDPALYEADLASSLTNLGGQQATMGDRTDALGSLTTLQAAVDIYRRRANNDPDSRAAFARSLNNLGAQQGALGDPVSAVASLDEAASGWRTLLDERPNQIEYLDGLAMALNNIGLQRAAAGDAVGAQDAAAEAAALRMALVAVNSDRFLPSAWIALHNLSIRQADAGDTAGSLETQLIAVEIAERLFRTNPEAFRDRFAATLSNLGLALFNVGDLNGALRSLERAVRLNRELVEASDSFRPQLANALHNFAQKLSAAKQDDLALEMMREAVEYYRPLMTANPAAFRHELAPSLNMIGLSLAQRGEFDDAIEAIEEAAQYYSDLVRAEGDRWGPDLERVLEGLRVVLDMQALQATRASDSPQEENRDTETRKTGEAEPE